MKQRKESVFPRTTAGWFITTIAGAGSQPFYGLLPLRQKESTVEQPFPYTPDHILYFLHMTEEEMDQFYDEDTPIYR